MSYIFEGDSTDAKRNRLSIIGGSSISYNAVISVIKSDELSKASAVTEPVLLVDAKAWLRIDLSDDDALLTALIKAARIACEKYANQSFISRTVTAKISNGLGNFYLPYGPVILVTSVKDGDTALSNYDVATPYVSDLTVVYTAGYSTLPEDIKVAIKAQIGFMYENRGDAEKASGLSEVSKLLLNSIRNV